MLVAVHPWDVDGAGRRRSAHRVGQPQRISYPAHFRRPDLEVQSLADLAGAAALPTPGPA